MTVEIAWLEIDNVTWRRCSKCGFYCIPNDLQNISTICNTCKNNKWDDMTLEEKVENLNLRLSKYGY